MEKFAKRLKELREEKQITQEQLERATGISQSSLTQWENQRSIPNAKAVVTLADFFDVTTDYLLGRVD